MPAAQEMETSGQCDCFLLQETLDTRNSPQLQRDAQVLWVTEEGYQTSGWGSEKASSGPELSSHGGAGDGKEEIEQGAGRGL